MPAKLLPFHHKKRPSEKWIPEDLRGRLLELPVKEPQVDFLKRLQEIAGMSNDNPAL